MAIDHENTRFYEEYVVVKSDDLLREMDQMIEKMQNERCNIRHYKQWESEMTELKNDYHVFQKKILEQLNDLQACQEEHRLEKMVSPFCEEIEDKYELLAQVFLEKRNEIKDKTTYFENLQMQSSQKNAYTTLKGLAGKIEVYLTAIIAKYK